MDKVTKAIQVLPGKNLEDLAIIGSWLFQKSQQTQRYYRRIIKEFFDFFPNLTLKSTQVTHLALFIKTFGEHSDATRNTYKNALSSLFGFAHKAGYIERNPAVLLENIKTPDRLYTKVLSREQVEQMILKEKNQRNKLILKILYFTGIRVDELCKLRRKNIQKTSDGSGYYMLVEGKGKKVRSINLPNHLVKDILKYSEKHEAFLYLFPSTHVNVEKHMQKALNPSQVFRIVRKAAANAKISVLPSPHWLRHTCATHSIEAGAPIHVVQKTLGHESISTTGKYLDIRPRESAGDYLKKI